MRGRFAALVGAAILVGACAPTWSPVAPGGTEQEAHVLAETSRFAAMLHVKVKGELTDDVYMVPAAQPTFPGEMVPAAGWYTNGVCHYWRPWVVKKDLAYGTALAAHEVCHAIEYNHNAKHEECIRRLL